MTEQIIPYISEKQIHGNISVFFVGLSHKCGKNSEVLEAFCDSTNSGKVISEISRKSKGVSIYRTNLVKGVPIDNQGKLRYPTLEEKTQGLKELQKEIDLYKPNLIFLCGKQVSEIVSKKLQYDRCIAIDHPSYISVYKRKSMDEYVTNIVKMIEKLK